MKRLILLALVFLLGFGSLAIGQQRLAYDGYIRSAKIYLGLNPKDYKTAAEMCENAIKFYPDKPPVEAHYLLGIIYADKKLYQEMTAEFAYVTSVCDTSKNNDVTKVCNKGNFAETISEIIFSKWLEVYNEGVATLKQARAQDTICQTIPDSIAKAECDSARFKIYQNALTKFKISTVLLPDSTQAWINLALTYYSLNDLSGAMETYRTAIGLASKAGFKPADVGLLSNVSSIYFNDHQFDSALHYFGLIIRQPIDEKSRGDVLYNMAICLEQLDNIDSAIVLLSEVLKITPESSDALFNHGAFLIKSGGKIITRMNAHRDSIEINEKKYRPALDTLDAQLKRLYRRAAEDFEKLILLQPDNTDALEWLGNAYFYLNEWEKSRDAYKKLVGYEPDNEDTWCQLALIYLKLNDPANLAIAKAKCTKYK